MDLHFNSFADRVRYALRDFTSVGSKTTFNIPVLDDEKLYRMNPQRYSFYMQLLDALQDPKNEVLDRILQVESKTRLAREQMEERLGDMSKNLRYLQLQYRKTGKAAYNEQKGGGSESFEDYKTKADEIMKPVYAIRDELEKIQAEVDRLATSRDLDLVEREEAIANIERSFKEFKGKYDANKIPDKLSDALGKLEPLLAEIKSKQTSLVNKRTELIESKSKIETTLAPSQEGKNDKSYYEALLKRLQDVDAQLQTTDRMKNEMESAKAYIENLKKTTIVNTITDIKTSIDGEIAKLKSNAPALTDKEVARLSDNELAADFQNEVNSELSLFKKEVAPAPLLGGMFLAQDGGAGEEGSYYQRKLDELDEIQENKDLSVRDKKRAVADVLDEVDTHPIYNPKFQAVSMTDRIIFIAMTFIIRGISLFLIDWGLNSHMINSFNRAFLVYIVIYLCIFLVWVLLVNAGEDGKNMFFGMLFYYVNSDANGMGRILLHLGVQLLLLPVPFIVKDRVVGKNPTWTYDQRRATFRVLSNFTFFIWILTSLIAMRY